MFLSDQLVLARLLADRQGCLFTAAAVNINGRGLLIVGSEADQTSIIKHQMDAASTGGGTLEILSDRTALVRRTEVGWQLYGAWCHGDEEQVSAGSARLCAICCVKNGAENSIILLTDGEEVLRRLLACLVVPLVIGAWWQHTVDGVRSMVEQIPCAAVCFDMSGTIDADLHTLAEECDSLLSSESITE